MTRFRTFFDLCLPNLPAGGVTLVNIRKKEKIAVFGYANKLADKIRLKQQTDFAVSAPAPAEPVWLADYRHSDESPQRVVSKLASETGVFALCGIVAFCGAIAVNMGYDWGYRLVEHFVKQTTGAHQGVWASESLMFLTMPMFFSIAYGCRQAWTGIRTLTKSSIATVMSLVLAGSYIIGSLNFDIGPLVALIWTAASGLFGYFGLWAGFKTCATLRTRVRVRALLSCGTAAILLLAASHLLESTEISVGIEMILYAAIITACGAWAVKLTHPRTKEAAVFLAYTGILPIILANVLNIAGNLLFLGLNILNFGPNLGWQALLSAVFINILTFSCSAIGGLIGFRSTSAKSIEMAQNAYLD